MSPIAIKCRCFFILFLLGVFSFSYFLTGCGSGSEPGYSDSSVKTKFLTVPADATCTIALVNVYGADQTSFDQAQQLLNQTRKQTAWPDLHIIRTDQVSKICRGYFKNIAEARRTLTEVRAYKDPQGQQPFQQAAFSALPTQEKGPIAAGPPEWDLRRARGNASLCISVFTAETNRTAEAANMVKKLRKNGTEAWYYHGNYRSGVYVGHFNAAYEFVTMGRTARGEPLRRQKFMTRDPQFKVLSSKFPDYRIDGQRLEYSIGKRKGYAASRLVPIPRFRQDVMDTEVGL